MPHIGRNDPCPCGSGRKYKKCCLTGQGASTPSGRSLPLVMDDLPTLRLLAFRASHFAAADSRAEKIAKRALIGTTLISVPKATWEGAEAGDHLRTLMGRLERAIEEVASKHTRIYWLMLLRRLGPADFYTYDRPQTAINAQRTAELASIKYGREGVDDIEGNVSVHSGPPDHSVENHPIGDTMSLSELWAKAQSASAYPRLGLEDFFDYIALCLLARDYYGLTASFRKVGKGAKLMVLNNSEIETVTTPIQDRLIALYDRRLEVAEADMLAGHGVSYLLDLKRLMVGKTDVPSAYALFRVSGLMKSREVLNLSTRLRVGIDAKEVRFVPGYIDLSEVDSIMQYSTKDFEEHHGLPWNVFLAFLVGLTWQVWLEAQGPMVPFKLATHLRRGYSIGRKDGLVLGALGEGAEEAMRKYFPNQSVSHEEMAVYQARFLQLALAQPYEIDLHSMAPSAFLVTSGNTVLVDFSQVPHFIFRTLPRRISDSVKDARADVAEALIGTRLDRIPLLKPAFAPKKIFKLHKKRVGEADLSYRVGRVLVLADAKAYAVFDEFDRGEYSAVNTRWGYVQGWLDQVDSLAHKLAQDPKGDNYDLTTEGYTHIFPIVCSTFHEYIGSIDPRYYLEDGVPRVAMPLELERFFGKADEASLKRHRACVPIRS